MAQRFSILMNDYYFETCYKETCKAPIMMTPATYETALERREEFKFFCCHGHEQHYVTGETELTIVRRERDRLKQQNAQKDDEIKHQRDLRRQEERSKLAYKGQVTKIKNRAGNGVCPCCNRSFENLKRHMESKHPKYAKEAV